MCVVLLVTCTVLGMGMLGTASANGTREAQVGHELYTYLFKGAQSSSLSTFPYCYDLNDVVHEYYNSCKQAGVGGCERNATHSALDVFVELSVNQILEVNERQRLIRLKITMYLMWTDCRLQWPPSRFPLHEFHVSIEHFRSLGVYVPAVVITEEVAPKAAQAAEKWLSISANGTVYLERMYTTEISCALNIYMYPFDTQACSITFESALEKSIVSLVNVEVPTSRVSPDKLQTFLSMYHLGEGQFTPSDTWECILLAGQYGTRNVCEAFGITGHDLCLYDNVVHRIILRRHPTYQLLNLLLPAFLISSIAGCVFLLPPDTSGKANLSITILLSLFFFIQVLYYKMPETGATVPLLTQYFIVCIGLIVLSCLAGMCSVILDSVSRPIPESIKRFLRIWGSIFAADRISTCKTDCSRNHNHSHLYSYSYSYSAACGQDPTGEESTSTGAPASEHWRVRRHCLYHHDWYHVAIVFDRIFFLVHFLASFGVLLGYLSWGYYSYSNFGFQLDSEAWNYREIQLKLTGKAS